jgi:uncharacterized protein YndB with AHSA1/START domain
MVEDVTSVIEIAAPRERVWRALSEPAQVARWMGCLRFEAAPGHVFYLQPNRARRGFPDVPDTYVDIRLREIPGGTHVRLVHSGWDQFDDRETEDVRGGLGHAWHSVALPALKAVAESSLP